MTERFSTQINGVSATPAPQPNNGKATSNTDFKDQVNDRERKFNVPPLSTKGDLERSSELVEFPRPQQTGSRLKAKVTAIASPSVCYQY